jgi:hypothetical protein
LNGLDALPSDFQVRFLLAQRLTLRVQPHLIAEEHIEICQPALGIRGSGGDNEESPLGVFLDESCREHGGATSWQSPYTQRAATVWELRIDGSEPREV